MEEYTKNRILIASTQSLTLNLFYDDIINTLIKNNYKVKLAVKDPDNLKYRIDNIKLDLPKNFYEILNIFKIIIILYKIRKIIKKNNNYIYLLNTPLVAHLFRLSSIFLKCKIIYFVHGYRFHDKSNFFSYIFFYILEYILSYKTNSYININSYDSNITINKFNKKNILIGGVGISSPKKIKNMNYSSFFRVGIISAYRKNKGYDEIIKVAKKIMKLNKNIVFDCYGYGDSKKFKNYTSKNDISNIKFHEFTNNIDNAIMNFDIFLHLSHREGLPVSLMQCLSHGVPIICTNIRGNRDLVKDKFNGHLVNLKNNSYEVCELILSFYNNRNKVLNFSKNAFISLGPEYLKKNISAKIIKFINEDI